MAGLEPSGHSDIYLLWPELACAVLRRRFSVCFTRQFCFRPGSDRIAPGRAPPENGPHSGGGEGGNVCHAPYVEAHNYFSVMIHSPVQSSGGGFSMKVRQRSI